jgi:hypothetical protein
MNCAPHRKGDMTCYTKEQLVKMAKILNQKEGSKIKLTGSKEEIWNAIRLHLFDECDYEWEWIDNKSIKELNDREIKYETFKPPMPTSWLKNKFTWLNTTDILNVMRQYEKLYNNFKFFGPVPVDCPKDIYCELTNIDLGKINRKGVNMVGVIFNLDKHNESGSHWVGLFVNMLDNSIIYYDSTGHPPPDYIKYFIEMLKRQMKNGVIIDWNKKKHQFGGSECGVYSMNFIIESIKGNKLSDIQNKNISDYSVNVLRNYFYRPPKKTNDLKTIKVGGKTKK